MSKRIGPKTQQALNYIASNPGCTKLAAATAVASSARYPGTSMCAFAPVNRPIRAGKVVAKQGKGNAYALYVAGSTADSELATLTEATQSQQAC